MNRVAVQHMFPESVPIIKNLMIFLSCTCVHIFSKILSQYFCQIDTLGHCVCFPQVCHVFPSQRRYLHKHFYHRIFFR